MEDLKIVIFKPGNGLYAPRRAINSPQNPANPGKPSYAIAVKAKIAPVFGRSFIFPPNLPMSLV